jgi:hypothetical protein
MKDEERQRQDNVEGVQRQRQKAKEKRGKTKQRHVEILRLC